MPRTQSHRAKKRSDELIWIRDSSSTTLAASASAEIVSFTDKLATVLGETPKNWTIERIIGNITLTVPAGTTPGRNYSAFLAIDVLDTEASNPPEPFSDQRPYPWVDGRTVFADHTVPASYASPAINGIVLLDMRSKRAVKGIGNELKLFGYHDNGLAANPTIFYTYSALFRMR